MNFIKENWTKQDYAEYQKYLKEIAEEEYRNFHKKLTSTKYPILGIRVPMQRKIAKEILKGNALSFLDQCLATTYEEVNIEGFVLAKIKKEELEKRIDSFVLKIDNWAICDGFCSSVTVTSETKEWYLTKIKSYLKHQEEFVVRVGIVLLLNHFVKKMDTEEILKQMDQLNREEYYINMAIAWLVAECFIKDPEKTWPFLKQNHLNAFTQNKAISKIRDSYRVEKEVKDCLLQYRK